MEENIIIELSDLLTSEDTHGADSVLISLDFALPLEKWVPKGKN